MHNLAEYADRLADRFRRQFPTGSLSGTLLVLLLLASTPTLAEITVPPGAAIELGNGELQLNCRRATVGGIMSLDEGTATGATTVVIQPGGTLAGANGVIEYSGDWLNDGAFLPGTSMVALVDDCGTAPSLMTGDNTFYRYSAVTRHFPRALEVAAGSEQRFMTGLELRGTDGGLLVLRSSVTDSPAFFVVDEGAQQRIDYVAVRDNDASRGARIAPAHPTVFNSERRSGVLNWFLERIDQGLDSARAIPGLQGFGLLVMIFLVALLGMRAARAGNFRELTYTKERK